MTTYNIEDIVALRIIRRNHRTPITVRLSTPGQREACRIRADKLEQRKTVLRVDCYTTKGTFI
jgi:hypothetical protein